MALANLDNPNCRYMDYTPESLVTGLQNAINRHASWDNTPQGGDFWSRQYYAAARNKRTPETCMGIDCTVPE